MQIGVDLDGVVSDFVSTFIHVVKEKYSVQLEPSQIYVHDLFLVLGITEIDAFSLVLETLSRNLDVVEGAREALAQLKANHKIVIITARPPQTFELTNRWLKRKRIPYNKLHYLIEGNKHQTELELDVFVDDHLREIIRFCGKVKKLVVFDRPWNKSLNVLGLFERASSWKDVISIIESMSK